MILQRRFIYLRDELVLIGTVRTYRIETLWPLAERRINYVRCIILVFTWIRIIPRTLATRAKQIRSEDNNKNYGTTVHLMSL